jgi:VIT1/CCC1 family predicted Fe2+/Mn2+ transporter
VMPPLIGDLLKEEHIAYLREEIRRLPEPPPKTIFTWNDIAGALKVFLLVFLSTFPVVIPFIFIPDTFTAIRISNGVALILLFIAGFYFGKRTHYRSLTTGLLLMGIGALLVFMTIALGG